MERSGEEARRVVAALDRRALAERREIDRRLAADVLNLTPRWKPEWGGLLGFVDSDDHIKRAFTPSWNALNILAVPQRHFVSMVAPFGTEGRYSVTGWLRRR